MIADKEWPMVVSVTVRDEHLQGGLRKSVVEVLDELRHAAEAHQPMRSLHEAFGILWEEVREFEDAVRIPQNSPQRLAFARRELVQIAAMALRALVDVKDGKAP